MDYTGQYEQYEISQATASTLSSGGSMLIDTLLSATPEDEKALYQAFRTAIRFKVDNVARYYTQEYNSQGRHLRMDDIPNVAPLAPVMWFEFAGNVGPDQNLLESGCLLSVLYDASHQKEFPLSEKHPETQWLLLFDSFARVHGAILRNPFPMFLYLDKTGKIIGFAQDLDQQAGQTFGLSAESIISFLSICFAHCKGTIIRKQEPGRRALRSHRQKGTPLITYHVLDIRPTTRILSEEGHIATEGIQRALHICRGHFAHYTEVHPLFGRYVGTVYRPMHVRGTPKQGIVGKDYRVHAHGSE